MPDAPVRANVICATAARRSRGSPGPPAARRAQAPLRHTERLLGCRLPLLPSTRARRGCSPPGWARGRARQGRGSGDALGRQESPLSSRGAGEPARSLGSDSTGLRGGDGVLEQDRRLLHVARVPAVLGGGDAAPVDALDRIWRRQRDARSERSAAAWAAPRALACAAAASSAAATFSSGPVAAIARWRARSSRSTSSSARRR